MIHIVDSLLMPADHYLLWKIPWKGFLSPDLYSLMTLGVHLRIHIASQSDVKWSPHNNLRRPVLLENSAERAPSPGGLHAK